MLALLAFALVLTTNLAAVAWSVAAVAVTLVYPFSKRFFSMPQAVLGVAFSFGIPMAFAAVRGGDAWTLDALHGAVPLLAWVLLAGNLFWVLAYDTEYAMVDRDDDLRIGIRTSAITLGRHDVAAVMAFYAVFLAVWAGVGVGSLRRRLFRRPGGGRRHRRLALHADPRRTREGCFRAFTANHWLGFAVFAGVVAQYGMPASACPCRARCRGLCRVRDPCRGHGPLSPP